MDRINEGFPPRNTISRYLLSWESTVGYCTLPAPRVCLPVGRSWPLFWPRDTGEMPNCILPIWVCLVKCTTAPGSKFFFVSLCESFYVEDVRYRLDVIDAHRMEWLRKRKLRTTIVVCSVFFLILLLLRTPFHVWLRPTLVIKCLMFSRLTCPGWYLPCCCRYILYSSIFYTWRMESGLWCFIFWSNWRSIKLYLSEMFDLFLVIVCFTELQWKFQRRTRCKNFCAIIKAL